jgi:Pectate lyase superfamily protein
MCNLNRKSTHHFSILVVIFFICLVTNSSAQSLEEFSGPFASWADVKTEFSAKGDGVSDDTRAIQNALDHLHDGNRGGLKRYSVLYFPKGIYYISSTLVLKGMAGVSIVGEDPANTIIRWRGSDNDTMLWTNGSAYFKIARLTWDANKKVGIEGIGIHWKERWKTATSESFAAVNIEISDNNFIGGFKFGISGGTDPDEGTGWNDSEVTIRRCKFIDCINGGIKIHGYNALDYWIWDCTFVHGWAGVTCVSGNYHVYRSLFIGLRGGAVINSNGYYVSLRGCYVEKSHMLSYDWGASCNPFKRIFQGNTITTPDTIAIFYPHVGKISLIDNVFDRSSNPKIESVVSTGSWCSSNYEVLSIGNTYQNKKPIYFSSLPNKLYTWKDQYREVADNRKMSLFQTSMSQTPERTNRKIFDVPLAANADAIQKIITLSSKAGKAMVHFPSGKFTIDHPLQIPTGADLVIVGDGNLFASQLFPGNGFPKGRAILEVSGPTQVVVQDLQLGSFDRGIQDVQGIKLTSVDQAGSQLFMDQIYSNSTQTVSLKRVDNLFTQKSNSFFSDGTTLTGGPLTMKGKGSATLYSFGGQFKGAFVDGKAKMVFKDSWWEGSQRIPIALSGEGNVTIDGAMIAPNSGDSTTTIKIDKFKGKLALCNLYMQGDVQTNADNSNLRLLLWNIHFYHVINPLKFLKDRVSFPGAYLGLTTECFLPNNNKCGMINAIPDRQNDVPNVEEFIADMLTDDREAIPRKFMVRSTRATNILLSRVSLGDCSTGVSYQ